MSSTDRDTHFAGFASLLWGEMKQHHVMSEMLEDISDRAGPGVDLDPAAFERDMQSLIAKRAYDLVVHTLDHTREGAESLSPEENLEIVPDLTAWPETE